MRNVRTSVVGGGVALLVVALTVVPVVPAAADDTTVTFTVTAGVLDITVPASTSLGTGAPGTVISGQLGVVTVTDLRASADASWTVTVTATNFTTGNGTFTPGQVAAANLAPLNNTATLTAYSHTGGTGNNTAAWNPTLAVRVPLGSQARTYTGTVTHSVA